MRLCRTVGAHAPVRNFGGMYAESVRIGRGQTRGMTNRAVNVGDRSALGAHDVVVVVINAEFVPPPMTCRLNEPHNSGVREVAESVVHRLQAGCREGCGNGAVDLVGTRVWLHAKRGIHGPT